MGNTFQGVRLAMGKIVVRVNAPFVAGLVMTDLTNPINNRVAQIDVWRGHINFRPQHFAALIKLTVAHSLKQCQVFFWTAIAERTITARLGKGATIFSGFIGT